jgi:hypothetical protein
MSIPMSVDSDRLRQVYTISGHCSATDILTGGMSRGFWEPVLIWSASQFQEENGLFFLAATKYRQAPTKAKMDYIYRHFVGHGKTLADRAINLPSAARERTFELVTGAQTKHFHQKAEPSGSRSYRRCLAERRRVRLFRISLRCCRRSSRFSARAFGADAVIWLHLPFLNTIW